MVNIGKILSKNSFTGSISKLVELEDSLIMNGIEYDKDTKKFNGRDAYDIITNNNAMILKRLEYVAFGGGTDYLWVKDNKDENTYYVISNQVKSETYAIPSIVYIITKGEEVSVTEVIISPASSSYTQNAEIIGQNDDFVFLNVIFNGATPYKSYVNKMVLNKKTKKMETVTPKSNLYSMYTKVLSFKDQGVEEIYYDGYNNNMVYDKYYISDDNYPYGYQEYKSTIPMKYVNHIVKPSSLDKKTNKVYFPYVTQQGDSLGFAYFDRNDNTFKELVVRDGNSMLDINNLGYYTLHCETFWENGKHFLFLGVTISAGYSSYDTMTYLKPIKFYLFEIENNNQLILKDLHNGEDHILYSNLIFLKEERLVLCCSKYAFTFLKIDTINDVFEKTFIKQTRFDASLLFGVGEDGKIYRQLEDTSIEEMSVGVGANLIVDIEKEVYNYNGVDINSNVKVGFKDILGNFIDVKILLKLYGNATFDDNSKQKEIQLTKNGISTIPIIIKGQGKISANATLIDEKGMI